jgi:Ca2+/Na+ antiporter
MYNTALWLAYLPQMVVLVMLVLEVFHHLFSPTSTLPAGTLTHFIEATLVCIAVIAGLTLLYPGQPHRTWVVVMWAMDQGASWVMLAIFGLIALLASYFGIPPRHQLQGIALGFFVYLTVDCVIVTITAQTDLELWPVDMAAFLLACLIWAYYFASPEVERKPFTTAQLRRLIPVLRSMRRTLSEIHQDKGLRGAGDVSMD